jgi:uncharacterized protein YbjT (DUF2867 family)
MTRTLVLGGTGTTGGRVVDRLAALGLPVRIGSRTAEPPFDWRREATWMPALRGVDAVYLAFQPHLAAPGAANAVRAFAGAAAMAGVRRLVLLSCRGEAGALAAEQAVRQSSVPWTIVRAAWFDQDFSEGYLYDSRGEFDFVHTRLVLIHVPERDAVLRRLADALRPGGVLLVEEDDIYPLATTKGAYREAWDAVLELSGAAGLDGEWGVAAVSRYGTRSTACIACRLHAAASVSPCSWRAGFMPAASASRL